MSNLTTTWNNQEFKTYLFLYCANADFVETKEEKELIISKVGNELLEKMHTEFDADSDHQRIQKLMSTIQRLGYSDTEKNELVEEVKALFLSDENFDILERNLLMMLKKLIF